MFVTPGSRAARKRLPDEFAIGVAREKLISNRAYYVATTGSDLNDGRTASAPFRTIQHAIDIVSETLDFTDDFNLSIEVRIQVADGTYDEFLICGPYLGFPSQTLNVPLSLYNNGVVINGNSADPNAVVIQPSGTHPTTQGSAAVVSVFGFCNWQFANLKLDASLQAGYCDLVLAYLGGFVTLNSGGNPVKFGAVGAGGGSLITSYYTGYVYCGDGTIQSLSGNYTSLVGAYDKGIVDFACTFTLSGDVTFSVAAFVAGANGNILDYSNYNLNGHTITGSWFNADGNNTLALYNIPAHTGEDVATHNSLVNCREKLTADRTYYVATTGSDASPGTVGSPFLTLQHAYDVIVATLDLGGNDVTVQVGDGTYADGIVITTQWVGGGTVTIQGNTGNANSVFIDSATSCFVNSASLPGTLTLQYMKLQCAAGSCINNTVAGAGIVASNVNFGSTVTSHVRSTGGGTVTVLGDVTISGGGERHISSEVFGSIFYYPDSVTLSGTPAFSDAFALSYDMSSIDCFVGAGVFAGTGATGPRFSSTVNSVINTYTLDLSFFPGDTSGILDGTSSYDGLYDATASQTLSTTGASQTIDYSLGAYVILNLGHNVTTLTVSNWHPNGTSRLTLEVRNTGAFNITFPTGWLAVGGAAPTITSGNGKKDVIVLTSEDAGTTVYIHTVGQNFSAIP